MFQGSTPKHIFTIPFDSLIISDIQIMYGQNGALLIDKRKSAGDFDTESDGKNTIITAKLTQEETFLFDDAYSVDIQLRVLTTESDAFVSDKIKVSVKECLSNEVLT